MSHEANLDFQGDLEIIAHGDRMKVPKEEVIRDELYEVCLVVNGPLDMGEGKKVCQAFQVAARMLIQQINPPMNEHEWARQNTISKWFGQGTRTIAKEAITPDIFERVVSEVPGFMMVDEGFTEVDPDSPTIYATYPYLHGKRPKVLDNKKVRLL